MTEKPNLLPTWAVREIRDAHRGGVSRLDWNCQGKKLATGSVDEIIRIWNVELTSSGKDKREAELGLGREPNEVLWHPSHPDLLASSAADNLIKVWDVRTSKVAYTTKLKKQGYMYIAWNPVQQDVIAAVHQDSDIFFIDSRKQKLLSVLPSSHTTQVNEVKFSRDGKLFFRCAGNGIEIFSYPELVKLHTYVNHAAKVYSMDIADNDRVMATGGADGLVSVTDMQTLTSMRTFFTMDSAVKQVGFSCDGQFLAYFCYEDKGVFIEKFRSGERATFLETQDQVACLKWNPKHMMLAYSGSFLDGGRTTRQYGNINIFAARSA